MTNYPSLSKLYEQRRADNALLRKQRIQQAYETCPKLSDVEDELRSLTLKKSLNRIRPSSTVTDWDAEAAKLTARRQALLTEYNIPSDYMDEIFTCALCKDEGYVDGEYCTCYLQWKADLLLEHSPIYKQMEKENFDTFDICLYSDEVQPEHSKSPRENMRTVYENARHFANAFPNCKNLLLQGPTGVGKTFLTNCIAKELIGNCVNVCYLSANNFFDILSAHTFSKTDSSEARERYQLIYNCDLLIIDDLGTELHSAFVDSVLFEVINERHKKDLRIIISTNLTMKQFGETYSKRTLSRVKEQFEVLPIYGTDIRMAKGRV